MKKVLIIDDETLVRRSLKRVLSKNSFNLEILEAADGVEGKNIWLSEKPDLVIVDVLMPGLTGYEVIADIPDEIRQKVILISAHEKDVQAEQLGINLFIAKPFDNIFLIGKKILEVLA